MRDEFKEADSGGGFKADSLKDVKKKAIIRFKMKQ